MNVYTGWGIRGHALPLKNCTSKGRLSSSWSNSCSRFGAQVTPIILELGCEVSVTKRFELQRKDVLAIIPTVGFY